MPVLVSQNRKSNKMPFGAVVNITGMGGQYGRNLHLNRLFLESKDLLGYLKYNSHTFFLLENCDKFFTITKQYEKMKIDKEQDIVNDDRFEIYFFGYSNDQFYRFIL